MIKLTDRDYEVLSFIKEYKCADTDTLTRLFFQSKPTCEKRLRKLVECNKLNRYREDILHPYVYYKGQRPTNIKHSLAIARVYSILQSEYEVVKCKREYQLKYYNKVLQCDLLVVIRRYGKLYPIIVEIDLTKCYSSKYDSFINTKYYQQYFPSEPIVLVISNRTPKANTSITWLRLDEIDKIGSLL